MRLTTALTATALALLAALPHTTAAATTSTHSFGTLLDCPRDAACLWSDAHGHAVDAATLRRLLLAQQHIAERDAAAPLRNLQRHMQYLEHVHRYAQSVGHAFTYHMGVTARHLTDTSTRTHLPEAFVHNEMRAGRPVSSYPRQLATAASSPSGTAAASSSTNEFNWCTTSNPRKRSVCSAIKSQQNCGSCWAFAATDAIEAAVAIAANQSAAVALAPQQLLSCSTRETEQSFTYCWAAGGSASVPGVAWLSETIKWKSTNNGCDGGMTHGAFMDAAQLQYGLVTELVMPYNDGLASSASNSTCVRTSNQTAASISDWKQVVGTDCSVSSDPNVLLKAALQDQPIAVAINSEDPFKDYKGGFFSCPNNGDLASKDNVNHALVLVGYGTDATVGDYWILKNSYGSAWGDKGFLRLIADQKANCGVNIFPVVPVGAKAGVATAVVDGGGDKVFAGLGPSTWIALAVSVSIATFVATAIGLVVATRRRKVLRDQVSRSTSIDLAQSPTRFE